MDPDSHNRVIVHIDLDCYYAQVEMNKDPKLRNVPMGVQQKYAVVTSNYIAREFGVKKCMTVTEAKKLCPSLVLVNGEDLHDYRQTSYKVTSLMQKYTSVVERLGLDENFLDVTELVNDRLSKSNDKSRVTTGNVFNDESDEKCDCGCFERLAIGSVIASEIRDCLKSELNLNSCGGIAHNKLLAKIVGATHRPNQQTVIFPNSASELMLSLESPMKVPGIGQVLYKQLETINVKSIHDLQNIDMKTLQNLYGLEKSKSLKNWSFGVDPSPVKLSGRPLSIGIEDSYQSITAEKEIQDKLEQLLQRLLILVDEDGRAPKTIKITVRKLDKCNKTMSHRETRQCNINPGLFTHKVSSSNSRESKIMSVIMSLFNKIIEPGQPYHITLLGLSCTKFQELPRTSIAAFLRKNDLEVQSITSIESKGSNDEMLLRSKPSTSKIVISEPNSPILPCKKPKTLNLVPPTTKRRFFEDCDLDCGSPSKLRVEDLCLESKDNVCCPPNVDKDVFKEIPRDIQKELWDDFKRSRESEINFCSSQVNKKSKPNTLLNYFVKN